MAEAIGLTASVLGILLAAAKVTRLCFAIQDPYQDAPKLLSDTAAEVAAVETAVRGIQQLLVQSSEVVAPEDSSSPSAGRRDPLAPPEAMLMTLTHCVITLSSLEKLLEDFHGKKRRLLSIGLLPRTTKEMENIMGKLQWEKLSLCLLLQVANRSDTQGMGMLFSYLLKCYLSSENEADRKREIMGLTRRLDRLLAKDEDMATRSMCISEASTQGADSIDLHYSFKSNQTIPGRVKGAFGRTSFGFYSCKDLSIQTYSWTPGRA